MIIENISSAPATQEDAAEWASTYGLTFPVLADPANTGWNYIGTDPNIFDSNGNAYYGLPNSQLLSSGMLVEKVNGGVSENDIIQALQ